MGHRPKIEYLSFHDRFIELNAQPVEIMTNQQTENVMHNMKLKPIVMKAAPLFIIFCLITSFCGYAQKPPAKKGVKETGLFHKTRDYWPTQGWKISTPEEQNVNTQELLKAVSHIQEKLPDVYSLLIIKNGYLIFENYYKKGMPDRSDVAHSVTKSYTSTLIGVAIEKGFIKSVDQKISDFFPEYFAENIDPKKRKISIKDLLTMTAGSKWNDRGDVFYQWIFSPDWAKFTLQLEQTATPGEIFTYNTSVSHLLSVILTRSTKMSTRDFAQKHLFDPLGMTIHQWQTDPQGNQTGGHGLHLTPRDMAKLGYLFLNDGNWDGQMIVPPTWVKEATNPQVYAFHSEYGDFYYGYQWWIKKAGNYSSYRAWGRRGQNIVVVPEQDLVIVVTSETARPHPTTAHYSLLYDLIAEGVGKGYRADVPPGVQTLIDQYTQDFLNHDLEKVMTHISRNYFQSGTNHVGDKRALRRYYNRFISQITSLSITINEFEREGNKAHAKAVMKSNFGERTIEEHYILKEGKWKIYGNQERPKLQKHINKTPDFTFTYPDKFQPDVLRENDVLRIKSVSGTPVIAIGVVNDENPKESIRDFAKSYADSLDSVGSEIKILSNEPIHSYGDFLAYQFGIQWKFRGSFPLNSLIHAIAKEKHIVVIAGHTSGDTALILSLFEGLNMNP